MVEVDPSGAGDGSGKKCLTHSYSVVDEDHLAEKRVESLTKILTEQYGVPDERLVKALCALGEATAHIAVLLMNYVEHTYAGTQNNSGDDQLHLDIDCDNAVFAALRNSGVFSIAASEETPVETDVGSEGSFSLGFDPLDGSSIIDANFSVGSIYGIWPGKGVLNRTGREQVAAAVALYGPRTTLCVALPSASNGKGKDHVLEVTLVRNRIAWELSRDDIVIQPDGKVFAPGNLRATNDNPQYDALVKHWISNRYTLRYSGGMVPDVYHIFAKSKGVFSNVSSEKAKAKLRLLYEVAPIGLMVECAQGVTTHEFDDTSVLDITIGDLDQRLGVCFGSANEVAIYKKFMFTS
ncbi:Fructose-1,6-bisphosphatase class 1 [Seminavis robusta]|uniref:Fructose-1,6-bisphosphatase class 1 n=1 Tax=Seminavis robusta TaxID=568900 RepID=A0A9N8HE17_9STRA|nr:Fructose-1,6-bisphosphatase class 1 [Seminavis robusta]|eukprot:Sro282_g107440.1 Fructose-1,6-bisphosphatase class 1 (351) ;mRNA; f:28045-29212